jgi:3'(2'), 5'-bisphosphate nucleotidase
MPARAKDHHEAVRIAEAAAACLLELRAGGFGDPRRLRATADRLAHDTIVDLLAQRFPDDPVLSEEGNDDPRRLASARVWIVDPLDGTREYGEEGRTDWAVHVALVVDGEPQAAAVALPARGLVAGTAPPFLPPPPAGGATAGPLRVAVSRSRPPAEAGRVRDALGAVLVPIGSAGAKIMAVVTGEVEAYVHAGGQYEWDSAAPVGVALAAGYHASRLDGSPLRYNRPDPWLPDLLVCRPELADGLLGAV